MHTGNWGDQRDGTYINPILNADYPDVDVEQLGDTYYMISSKQHMAPGMVILESKDMVIGGIHINSFKIQQHFFRDVFNVWNP